MCRQIKIFSHLFLKIEKTKQKKMNFSEYSKLNIVERPKPVKNIVMSHIPMFDQNKFSGKSFYKTTYNEEFHKKQGFADNSKAFKNPDFAINNPYNFQELSDRLVNKNAHSASSQETNQMTNANLLTDSQFYKRPHIPDYIKRDNFFQTNTEKNIEYLHTLTGLVPIMKSTGQSKDDG